MKIRQGFVSNSSSSSFVISKEFLTPLQVVLIKHHSEVGAWLGIAWAEDAWSIYDNDMELEGYTVMDNFDMMAFLHRIGVDMDKVDKVESW